MVHAKHWTPSYCSPLMSLSKTSFCFDTKEEGVMLWKAPLLFPSVSRIAWVARYHLPWASRRQSTCHLVRPMRKPSSLVLPTGKSVWSPHLECSSCNNWEILSAQPTVDAVWKDITHPLLSFPLAWKAPDGGKETLHPSLCPLAWRMCQGRGVQGLVLFCLAGSCWLTSAKITLTHTQPQPLVL